MGRAPCCDKGSVKKGPWSPEEDRKLKEYIHKHGTGGNWIALPTKAGLKRCGKSCRLRWLNYLRPNIKHGDFSGEEDMIICNLFATIGSRWSVIAAHLPGRTDNDIKNYWNTKLKKKLMIMAPLPPHVDHAAPHSYGHGVAATNHHHHHQHHNQQLFIPAASPGCDPVVSLPPLELPQYTSSSALLAFGGDHHQQYYDHGHMLASCSDNGNNVTDSSSRRSVGLESFVMQQLMQQQETTTTTTNNNELQAKKLLLIPAAGAHSINGGGGSLLLDQVQYEDYSSSSNSNAAAAYSCYDQPAPETKPLPMVAPPISTSSLFYGHASQGRFLY